MNLEHMDMSSSLLCSSSFTNTNVVNADFSKADLSYADFTDADAQGARFAKADLSESIFYKCEFVKCKANFQFPVPYRFSRC
ncbi:pentapeptide repeat-containing protein [uncultured Paenibacillus sp.]|nr:pentapeptide repeat-containing protein [uncultured Paenibacillus sp.]